MANTYQGYGILWGVGSLLGTIAGMGTLALNQDMDFSVEADEDLTKDSSGNTAAVTKYDHKAKANLNFVYTVGTNLGTAQVTHALTALALPGVTIALTDANFTPITSAMIIDSIGYTRSNTKAMMAKISLTRYLNNAIP